MFRSVGTFSGSGPLMFHVVCLGPSLLKPFVSTGVPEDVLDRCANVCVGGSAKWLSLIIVHQAGERD